MIEIYVIENQLLKRSNFKDYFGNLTKFCLKFYVPESLQCDIKSQHLFLFLGWKFFRLTDFASGWFFVLLKFSSNCDMNQRKRLIFQFPIIKKLDSSILGFKKLRIFDVKSKFLDDRWFNENFAGEHSRKFCTFWKKYIQFDTENSVFEVKITSSYEIFSARTLSWILAGFWAEFHIRARIKIKFFSGPKNPGRKFLGRVAVAEP